MDDATMAIMLAEWSCTKAIHRYAKAADGNDVDAFLDAFTPDGIWLRPDGQAVKGHAALHAFYVARPQNYSRHIISNIVVDVSDVEHATATSIGVVVKAMAPVTFPLTVLPQLLLADYEDSFRRCDDGHWRISHRRVTLQADTRSS